MVKMTKLATKILYSVLVFTMLTAMVMPVFAAADPGSFASGATVSDAFDEPMRKILGIVQGIGIGVAVIILVVIGIKYMMGSAEEKAEYKKTLLPYVIGAILIGGAPAIASAVYKAFQ